MNPGLLRSSKIANTPELPDTFDRRTTGTAIEAPTAWPPTSAC